MNLQNMVNYQYFMEATALLPDIKNLNLRLVTRGHVVGTCVFHMLKISTSIRRLNLDIHEGIKVRFTLLATKCFGALMLD